MSQKKSGKWVAFYLILNALFWAGVMLGGTYIFRAEEWADQIVNWGIVGWFVTNGILAARVSKLTD